MDEFGIPDSRLQARRSLAVEKVRWMSHSRGELAKALRDEALDIVEKCPVALIRE